MFKNFKKIAAYTKMANALDKLNILLGELKHKIVAGSDPHNLKEEILVLTYIVRRDVYNPQEEFGWTSFGPIRITSISGSNITLQAAFETIQGEIDEIGSYCDIEMRGMIESILNKEELYYQFDNLPGINRY